MGGLHGGNGRKRTRLEVGVVGHLEGFARMKFGRENVDGDCVIWKRDDAPIDEDKVNGGVRGESQCEWGARGDAVGEKCGVLRSVETRVAGLDFYCGIRTAPANESRECWLEWHGPSGRKVQVPDEEFLGWYRYFWSSAATGR
jgi:hypothetical protein